MDRFVSLAGGKDRVPAFIYGLNQNEALGFDGIMKRRYFDNWRAVKTKQKDLNVKTLKNILNRAAKLQFHPLFMDCSSAEREWIEIKTSFTLMVSCLEKVILTMESDE